MKVLGIETSTAVCSVGMVDGEKVVSSRSVHESHIHSEKLLTMVQEVCPKIGLGEIDGVAVSMGPGSFTGLRIGLSAAKGLCVALGRPLVGVPTFDAVASTAMLSQPGAASVLICVNASRGMYFAGRYERAASGEIQGNGIRVQPLAEIPRYPAGVNYTVITDSKAALASVFDSDRVFDDIEKFWRGDSVALLGERKLRRNEITELQDAEPMYLRDFVIRQYSEETQDRHSHGLV